MREFLGEHMFRRLFLIGVFLLVLPAAGAASDPVRDLQDKINKGEVKLEFDAERGYLSSLLKVLNVPISSQALVFSKTSLQNERISPDRPRAVYFNDDVYVAWAQETPLIEIMALDPEKGSAFYFLSQQKDDGPQFERLTGHECSSCHYDRGAAPKFVPQLQMSSVIPGADGNVEGTFPIPTTDRSPFEERWGGWYVSGSLGNQKHLGNMVNKTPASAFGTKLARVSNLTGLSSRFDTGKYLSPHSDVVALMVLAHQTEVQNLIALASLKTAAAPQEVGEPLVKALFFVGAQPLTAPIQGTSNFAAEFAAQGPLREFDLKTRFFRYPLSYLIYSKPFDALPQPVKTFVYRRIREVLTGTDKSPSFAHLSAADRTALLEILRKTKPDFLTIN
jgi:hypothetical protein